MMTKKKALKTLSEANITAYSVASRIEIVRFDEDGDIDRDATEHDAERAIALTGWGGFRTGSGSWMLDKNLRPADDYNDRASAHHF